LNQIKGSEYSSNEKDKVMERMDWLNHLRLVFNITAGSHTIHSSSLSVKTEAFLDTLIENISKFPLVSAEDYKSSVQFLSFRDIFECFEAQFGQALTWDYVLNAVVFLKPHEDAGQESPRSIDLNELVFINTKLSSNSLEVEEPEVRSRRLSDLRIPQAQHENKEAVNSQLSLSTIQVDTARSLGTRTMDSLPENLTPQKKNQKPSFNLSGRRMAVLNQKMPDDLVVLNLSYNHFSNVPKLEGLQQLEYLDLSWNFIQNIKGIASISTLKELYLSHNQIRTIAHCLPTENLYLLDLSHNLIRQLQGIEPLVRETKLKVLSLEGNPIQNTHDFPSNFKDLLPQVEILNPLNISIHSKYKEKEEVAPDEKEDQEAMPPMISEENKRCIRSLISTRSMPALRKKV